MRLGSQLEPDRRQLYAVKNIALYLSLDNQALFLVMFVSVPSNYIVHL